AVLLEQRRLQQCCYLRDVPQPLNCMTVAIRRLPNSGEGHVMNSDRPLLQAYRHTLLVPIIRSCVQRLSRGASGETNPVFMVSSRYLTCHHCVNACKMARIGRWTLHGFDETNPTFMLSSRILRQHSCTNGCKGEPPTRSVRRI